MSEPTKSRPSAIIPWPQIVVAVLAMIGASALALLLIPQLSLNAARRGATITIVMFLSTQIALRLYMWFNRRRQGSGGQEQRGDRA